VKKSRWKRGRAGSARLVRVGRIAKKVNKEERKVGTARWPKRAGMRNRAASVHQGTKAGEIDMGQRFVGPGKGARLSRAPILTEGKGRRIQVILTGMKSAGQERFKKKF